ncbi:MAG: SsrA-binding protein SmpB [Bacilli bacterium]|nr:SsrA-binding protein SmpB [Bacilli bacterium]
MKVGDSMVEINNRKAKFDYEIIDTVEAGIVLTGTEVKSIRKGSAQLKDSYALVRSGEAYLLNMHISEYKEGNIFNHEETRTRKLLLHKKEIIKLQDKVKIEGYTLVPLKLYFKQNHAKVLIGIAKGKKRFDKRETIKKRDNEREIRRVMKDY